MRRWRKSTVEFCIKPINNFNIKSLSVVAFSESMENRVWLFTVWTIIFINLRRWEDLRRFTCEYFTMFRIIDSPTDRREIGKWSPLQNKSKKNTDFPELIIFLIDKHITIVRRVLKTLFVVNYVRKHPNMLERLPSENRQRWGLIFNIPAGVETGKKSQPQFIIFHDIYIFMSFDFIIVYLCWSSIMVILHLCCIINEDTNQNKFSLLNF